MEKEFRVIPVGEKLIPGKKYYYDSWSSLSKEILDSIDKKILWCNYLYDSNELEEVDLIILEECKVGEAPGNIKHSFYADKDLLFTYVINDK